jgi:hypothetical protein
MKDEVVSPIRGVKLLQVGRYILKKYLMLDLLLIGPKSEIMGLPSFSDTMMLLLVVAVATAGQSFFAVVGDPPVCLHFLLKSPTSPCGSVDHRIQYFFAAFHTNLPFYNEYAITTVTKNPRH